MIKVVCNVYGCIYNKRGQCEKENLEIVRDKKSVGGAFAPTAATCKSLEFQNSEEM